MKTLFRLCTVSFFTLHTKPSVATLRHSNGASKFQKRNFERHLQVNSSLSEDYYLLELIVDTPMDSKSSLEATFCKARGDLLPFTEYLGIVMNESGRKFLEKVATRKKIPVEDVLWLVNFQIDAYLRMRKEHHSRKK